MDLDTGSLLDEGIREWLMHAEQSEIDRTLRMLTAAGFKPELVKQKGHRGARVRYHEGDVFRVPLADGRFAYGRILLIEPPRPIFVELYPLVSDKDPSMEELARSDWLLKIHCSDDGIATGSWKVVGHLPVRAPIVKPPFWDDNPFDGKFHLRDDPVDASGQRETTLDEIARLRAQPAVLASRQSVEIVLTNLLLRGQKHEWVYPEESRNPKRDKQKRFR